MFSLLFGFVALVNSCKHCPQFVVFLSSIHLGLVIVRHVPH